MDLIIGGATEAMDSDQILFEIPRGGESSSILGEDLSLCLSWELAVGGWLHGDVSHNL
jgi:hypothetical protein